MSISNLNFCPKLHPDILNFLLEIFTWTSHRFLWVNTSQTTKILSSIAWNPVSLVEPISRKDTRDTRELPLKLEGPHMLNMGEHLKVPHHPCPICHEILLALSLKYIQNPTSILLTSSAAISLIKALLSMSLLDCRNSLLTCFPASTLDPP